MSVKHKDDNLSVMLSRMESLPIRILYSYSLTICSAAAVEPSKYYPFFPHIVNAQILGLLSYSSSTARIFSPLSINYFLMKTPFIFKIF